MRTLYAADTISLIQSLPSDFNGCFPQGGTVETEFVTDVAMANDGSVVISGSSNGDFMGVGVSVSGSSSSSLTENYNFIAVQLDSEGSEGWRWQASP